MTTKRARPKGSKKKSSKKAPIPKGSNGGASSEKGRNFEDQVADSAEELMQEAASDELFLADLNETMKDFGRADQEDHELVWRMRFSSSNQ